MIPWFYDLGTVTHEGTLCDSLYNSRIYFLLTYLFLMLEKVQEKSKTRGAKINPTY